jgi:hypothetical protein
MRYLIAMVVCLACLCFSIPQTFGKDRFVACDCDACRNSDDPNCAGCGLPMSEHGLGRKVRIKHRPMSSVAAYNQAAYSATYGSGYGVQLSYGARSYPTAIYNAAGQCTNCVYDQSGQCLNCGPQATVQPYGRVVSPYAVYSPPVTSYGVPSSVINGNTTVTPINPPGASYAVPGVYTPTQLVPQASAVETVVPAYSAPMTYSAPAYGAPLVYPVAPRANSVWPFRRNSRTIRQW